MSLFDNDDIIYEYSRDQAIDDGVLIDVSDTAKEVGIKCPIAITDNLYHQYIEPSDELKEIGQDVNGRLWDTLWILKLSLKKTQDRYLFFHVLYIVDSKLPPKKIKLKAVIDIYPTEQIVITIMLPEED